jgi:hypothetical protein
MNDVVFGMFRIADSCHPEIDAIYSSETSVLTRVTRRKIPEDGALHTLQSLPKGLI